MPYKVRAKLVAFLGDEDRYPCHFPYEIGEEIIWDGERLEGRLCPGIMNNVIPKMVIMANSGMEHFKRIIFSYHGGRNVKDPSMKKYDGVGFRTLKGDEPYDPNLASTRIPRDRGTIGVCGDYRTLAAFLIEPIGLADGGFFKSDYMRQMSILEKIKADPGLTVDDIINKYDDFERNEIFPPLNPKLVQFMLEEMAAVNYIELKEGKAYPKEK